METIISKNGKVTWNILSSGPKPEDNGRTYFKVACALCGYEKESRKYDLQKQAGCPKCSKKPAALKIDATGACVSICDFGMVEFVKEHTEQHGSSGRAAARHFIDTVKAHLSSEDPILDTLSEESVNAKVRRLTGKKKDTPQNHDSPPQNTRTTESKKYRVEADVKSVQTFLDKHIPGYVVLEKGDLKSGGEAFRFGS